MESCRGYFYQTDAFHDA